MSPPWLSFQKLVKWPRRHVSWGAEQRGGPWGGWEPHICICIPPSVSPLVRTVSFPCRWFMPGDTRRPVNGIFLFALLMNNNMSKRKIKTANPNSCRERDKKLNLASMMQRGKNKRFSIIGFVRLFFARSAKTAQHMTACGLLCYKQVQFSSSKTNLEQVTVSFFSLYILSAFSFAEILDSFAESLFFPPTSVSLFCFYTFSV